MRPSKSPSESLTEQQYLICPAHINHYGRLFGGQLLKWIDELAGIVAIRHCGATVTTAAIDNAIHREIERAYLSRNDDIWRKYFPDTSQCPKNKDFLCAVADRTG